MRVNKGTIQITAFTLLQSTNSVDLIHGFDMLHLSIDPYAHRLYFTCERVGHINRLNFKQLSLNSKITANFDNQKPETNGAPLHARNSRRVSDSRTPL